MSTPVHAFTDDALGTHDALGLALGWSPEELAHAAGPSASRRIVSASTPSVERISSATPMTAATRARLRACFGTRRSPRH